MPTADGRLTAAELAQVAALVQAQAAVRQQIIDGVQATVAAQLRTFSAWASAAAVAAMARRAYRVIRPQQVRMAQVTDAYLARVASIMLGQRINPVGAVDVTVLRRRLSEELQRQLLQAAPTSGIPADEADGIDLDDDGAPPGRQVQQDVAAAPSVLHGTQPARERPLPQQSVAGDLDVAVDPDRLQQQVEALDPLEPYQRLATIYRRLGRQGMDAGRIAEQVRQRAQVVAETDVSLAHRAQVRQFLTLRPDGILGYRRVVRPELSRSGPCGLCMVASDRMYGRAELMPLHARCVCTVLPVTAAADPGRTLNESDLRRIYGAAGGSTSGRVLKNVRVAVMEHGELGPVLTAADHRFRGPRDAAVGMLADRRQIAQAQLESLEQTLRALQFRGGDVEARRRTAAKYQAQIDALRAELARA